VPIAQCGEGAADKQFGSRAVRPTGSCVIGLPRHLPRRQRKRPG